MLHKKFTILLNFIYFCNGAIIPIHNRQGKLSLIEWTNYNYREPEGYGTYAFGYDVEDPDTNNIQFRNEEKLSNGSVVGSYGYLESTGNAFVVRYIADQEGYRAVVDNSSKLKHLKPVFLMPIAFGSENKNTYTEEENSSPGSKNVKNKISHTPHARIVSHSTHSYADPNFSSEAESNSFYYPQNILDSPDFYKKEDNVNSYPDPNFSSEAESNSFYYPQNILESPDFHKKEDNDKIIFPKSNELN